MYDNEEETLAVGVHNEFEDGGPPADDVDHLDVEVEGLDVTLSQINNVRASSC